MQGRDAASGPAIFDHLAKTAAAVFGAVIAAIIMLAIVALFGWEIETMFTKVMGALACAFLIGLVPSRSRTSDAKHMLGENVCECGSDVAQENG